MCGYTTLMKVGYYVNYNGEVTINDKDAEARNRGTQVRNLTSYNNYIIIIIVFIT